MQTFIPTFRGKTLDGRWVEWQYSKMPEMKNPIIFVPRDDWHHMSYEVLPETIGMSTGEADKNGKIIFSKDIVKLSWVDWYGTKKVENREVKFHEGKFCIWNDYEYVPLSDFCHIRQKHQEERNDCEIIWNTTDNPL